MVGKLEEVEGSVVLEGRNVDYRLYRVPRRKRIHLVVAEDGRVHVRAPRRCSRRAAESVILQHRAWALEALERVREQARQRPRLTDGGELPWLGGGLRLRLHADASARVQRRGAELWVQAPSLEEDVVRELLVGWYRHQARGHFTDRLMTLAGEVGRWPQRVCIRDQRTRWGSCSCRGTISLNWRLMLAPKELADYVLVHELCHLRHLDHSRAFWDLVESIVPDWRERRARLRALQPVLAF